MIPLITEVSLIVLLRMKVVSLRRHENVVFTQYLGSTSKSDCWIAEGHWFTQILRSSQTETAVQKSKVEPNHLGELASRHFCTGLKHIVAMEASANHILGFGD